MIKALLQRAGIIPRPVMNPDPLDPEKSARFWAIATRKGR